MPIANDIPGRGSFVWWIGRVCDRADPESLGRVRVRCLGWHTDDVELLPNDALPWATVMYPASPNPQINPPRIGDWVIGFFQDGENAQQPTVLGVMPTQGVGGFADDLADEGPEPLALRPSPAVVNVPGPGGIGNTQIPAPPVAFTAAGTPGATTGLPPLGLANALLDRKTGIPDGAGGTVDEPLTSYLALYPFNKATISESGHSSEMDDTPLRERVDLRHRTGTGIEMNPGGDMNIKTINDANWYITGNFVRSTTGGEIISIGQGLNLQTSGGAGIIAKVDGGGGIDITVTGGDVKINVTGNVDLNATGNITQKCDGAMTLESTGPMVLKGSTIDLN